MIKRRITKSKEKRNWRVDIIFCKASMESKEEIEWKERKKKR
jgi:hypothetical protein